MTREWLQPILRSTSLVGSDGKLNSILVVFLIEPNQREPVLLSIQRKIERNQRLKESFVPALQLSKCKSDPKNLYNFLIIGNFFKIDNLSKLF
jgi:hypothetical protein